jgi:hypothetical protein
MSSPVPVAIVTFTIGAIVSWISCRFYYSKLEKKEASERLPIPSISSPRLDAEKNHDETEVPSSSPASPKSATGSSAASPSPTIRYLEEEFAKARQRKADAQAIWMEADRDSDILSDQLLQELHARVPDNTS